MHCPPELTLRQRQHQARLPAGPARRPPPRPGPARHRHRAADGGARRDHRQRRAAAHPAGARLLRHRPGMGGQRLRAGLRRAAAARRPGRGPARPPQGVHRRPAAVLGGLAGWRVRHLPGVAARGPRRPGRRRRDHRADRAVAGRHHLPRGPAAEPGDGRVRRDERRRRRGRPDRRRPADHLRVLAVGAVRQRADRLGGRAVRAAGAPRVRAAPGPVRPARRDHRHRRARRPGLRPVQRGHQPGRRLALGRCQGRGLAGRSRGAAGRVRGHRDPQRARAAADCGSCATATGPART